MITGAAFLDLILGVMIFAGISPSLLNLGLFSDASDSPTLLTLLGILFVGWLLYHNARYGVPEATSQPDAIQNQLSTSRASLSKGESGLLKKPEGNEMGAM